MRNKGPETAIDRFRVEEEKIQSDVRENEKYYNRIIAEQEKIRDVARVKREKIQEVLASMISDFERIEGELEAEETARLESLGVTRQALDDGRITAADYFQRGLTTGKVAAKAQAAAGEKLADLRGAVRAKGVALLEAEEAELKAEYEINFARCYPAQAMRERLAGLLVALEASLRGRSPSDMQYAWHAKLQDLGYAQGKRLSGTGTGWLDFDLAGLKRLRLDPTWPETVLPELDKIISEARAAGCGCRLMLAVQDGKPSISVMW